MRFVMIERRSGELIPVNPGMVCYVRQVGVVSTVALANGVEHKVQIPAAELVAAFERGMAGDGDVDPVREPAREPDPAAPAPAQGALALEPAPEPAPTPETADSGLSDEEQAELQGRAQRKQETDEPGRHTSKK
jgi:hypothetical protein